jgi:hypothetical protein
VKALTILWHRCKSRHPENHMAVFINDASRQSRQFDNYLLSVVTTLLPMVNFKLLHPLKGNMKWLGWVWLKRLCLPPSPYTKSWALLLPNITSVHIHGDKNKARLTLYANTRSEPQKVTSHHLTRRFASPQLVLYLTSTAMKTAIRWQ